MRSCARSVGRSVSADAAAGFSLPGFTYLHDASRVDLLSFDESGKTSGWIDSAGGAVAYQHNSLQQPVALSLDLNGRNALAMDGSMMIIDSTSVGGVDFYSAPGVEFTEVALVKFTASGGYILSRAPLSSSSRLHGLYRYLDDFGYINNGNNHQSVFTADDDWHLFVIVHSGLTAKIFMDDMANAAGVSVSAGAAANSSTRINLGGRSDSEFAMTGGYAFIGAAPAALDESQRQSIKSRVLSYWGEYA